MRVVLVVVVEMAVCVCVCMCVDDDDGGRQRDWRGSHRSVEARDGAALEAEAVIAGFQSRN